ncbi:MAG: peptidase [Nitrosopumilaceae archaeon]|nr:peptidase [Nitrosopumilaceae archaeon]NIV65133.1 peptidase [Nitrosopumilaceae archaeon]
MRIVCAGTILAIASFLDFKYREIHDKFWLASGIITGLIILIFYNHIAFDAIAISLLIMVPVSLMLWKIGFFGGADSFALIILAALIPQISLVEATLMPFTILTNSLVLIVIPVFFNVFYNSWLLLKKEVIFEGFCESRYRKIVAFLIGYRSKNPKFGFIMQKGIDGKKKFLFEFHNAEQAEFCRERDVWVTPGLPFLILILGGFLVQIFYGDFMTRAFLQF